MLLKSTWAENNISQVPAPGPIISAVIKNNWGEVFLIDSLNERNLTYADFMSAVLYYNEWWQGVGAKRGATVAVIMPNGLELLLLYGSALLRGLTVVPIDQVKGETEIVDILKQVNCALIIGESPAANGAAKALFIKILPSPGFNLTKLKDLRLKPAAADAFNNIDADYPFLSAFTSGSTGLPKGVLHSIRNLVWSAVAFNERFNFNGKNIFYHNLPMTYMAGVLNLFILPLVAGSKIVIGERFAINKLFNFWQLPIKFKANTFWFIPTLISLLLKFDSGERSLPYASGSSLIGCVGTAPLAVKMRLAFEQKYGIPLYESYGLSETLFISTNSPGRLTVNDSVGQNLRGINVTFSADGEINLNAPWMFLGYARTGAAPVKPARPFPSGDLGKRDKKGNLFITGRKKDLIIKGGLNISPKRLEDFLESLNLMEECAVVGVPDLYLGEKIVCFFVNSVIKLNDNFKQLVNRRVKDNLGQNYLIDEFRQLLALPRTASGKVDKPKLKLLIKQT